MAYSKKDQQTLWQNRWNENRIGFHLEEVNPYLIKFWQMVKPNKDSRILVPLCGKSLDLVWLSRNHNVSGIELSDIAVNDFFKENNQSPVIKEQSFGALYQCDTIKIYQGDFFDIEMNCQYDIAYDRAALIALDFELRALYIKKLLTMLKDEFKLLLITLEYPQHKMLGPPFSVEQSEVKRLFSGFNIKELERKPIKEGKRDQYHLDYFDEVVWLIES